MPRKMNANDAINGKEGVAYAKVNGNNVELFFAESVTATMTHNKSTVKTIGRRMAGHKVMGAEGSGTMTLKYVSPLFRRMAMDYVKTGVAPTFDLYVENNDPASAAGRQEVNLYGCCLDSLILTKLDGTSDDTLNEECPFTFDDAEITEHFKEF